MTGKCGYMILKLDLEKAYDRMEQGFIKKKLEMLQLPPTIISLCLTAYESYYERMFSSLFYYARV